VTPSTAAMEEEAEVLLSKYFRIVTLALEQATCKIVQPFRSDRRTKEHTHHRPRDRHKQTQTKRDKENERERETSSIHIGLKFGNQQFDQL